MQHPYPPDHARHDAALIAGHAAGDLDDVERARADRLVADCIECRELRRDLVTIAAATRSVPPPATLARDLRLQPEQAERLRRGSWLRRLLRPFGSPSSPVRPMATAFTSLGVVGLVVGVTLSSGSAAIGTALSGQAIDRAVGAPAATQAAAPAMENQRETSLPMVQGSRDYELASGGPYRTALTNVAAGGDDQTAPPAAQPTKVAAEDVNQGGHAQGGQGGEGAVGQGGDAWHGGQEAATNERGEPQASSLATQPASMLVAGSLAMLAIGFLLFGLRMASRRVR